MFRKSFANASGVLIEGLPSIFDLTTALGSYDLLADSDVYVLSSLHEGMGIVLQEAMYAGLPIISTNIGGQNDLIEDGVNAVMVNPEDSEDLKNAIIKLYEDGVLREKFSITNREKIKVFYSDKIGKEFEEYMLGYI